MEKRAPVSDERGPKGLQRPVHFGCCVGCYQTECIRPGRLVRVVRFGEGCTAGRSPRRLYCCVTRPGRHRAEGWRAMTVEGAPSYADLEREVARLERELDEASAERAATSEILRVISSSPTDLPPVLNSVGA